jgi:hypothetical protein
MYGDGVKLPFKLDLNFYPEREDEAHWTLMQMFDGRSRAMLKRLLRRPAEKNGGGLRAMDSRARELFGSFAVTNFTRNER